MTAQPDSPRSNGLPLDRIAAALRRERTRAGFSLSELAKRAGIAKSTLSQLEAANGKPGLETMWALSVALDVPPSTLLDPPRPVVRVVRAGQGPAVPSEVADYTATLLSASPPGARRDLYFLQVEPGSPRDSDPHHPGTTEHLVVGAGRVLAGPQDDPVELGPGDYLSYPGDLPHTCRALEPGTTCVLVMQHT
ncbi:helix-turn-helix domain-containing protein [Streptomyces sp. VRA16 Mangrove soil]|uniref:helix-turn-helix domain-containing protein n=1 Tax=Streptomyces sp. VRA16 Mangrove soil TaxID=2817434 RepID=UPI001A9DF361|nr:XRE family transcriptional regulator [Streptomyces sp. VRA16 Mangrove soil]MBO1334890.1 helix-turn-helix transcriptional regulator [Streptomyces sp. VRA16 Mangrove soil]